MTQACLSGKRLKEGTKIERMYLCNRAMILRWVTLLWSAKNPVMTRSFSHGQYYVSFPRINQSHVSQSTFSASQNRFTGTSNAGGRRSAFCFRKTFDSVGDHYTSRVHVSSATSFHPVNAHVGQCFPSGVQGRRQPKFLLQHLLAQRV